MRHIVIYGNIIKRSPSYYVLENKKLQPKVVYKVLEITQTLTVTMVYMCLILIQFSEHGSYKF